MANLNESKKVYNNQSKLIKLWWQRTSKKLKLLKLMIGQKNILSSVDTIISSLNLDTAYRLNYATMEYDYLNSSIHQLLGSYSKNINFNELVNSIIEAKIFLKEGIKEITDPKELLSIRKSIFINWEADYLLKSKDKRKIWINDVSYPWYDENGQMIGAIGYLRDITHRVNAELNFKNDLINKANSDPLTNLANRRFFFDHLKLELKRLQRTNSHYSVLLIDVDHFKKINDNYGHVVGDKILVNLAQKIINCLRESDLAARLGGEEFGVFLPDTPLEGASWVANRICKTIAEHKFIINDLEKPIKCTVSIGVSCSAVDYEIDKLYKLADNRLYAAKNTGRNQVLVSSEDVVIH